MPNEKDVSLNFEGEFVDIMCDVNPYNIPNIRYENGKNVVHLRILNALYGCIESALVWYEIYTETFQ